MLETTFLTPHNPSLSTLVGYQCQKYLIEILVFSKLPIVGELKNMSIDEATKVGTGVSKVF